MPTNKKPRQKRRPKSMRNIDGGRPIMRIFAKTHGVTQTNRIKAQNEVLSIISALESVVATKTDCDRAGYAGALWEALCRGGFGELNEPLAMRFEAARGAAMKRGEQLGKFGLSVSELDTIKSVLFGLIASIKLTPEPIFAKIDSEVRQFLGIK